MMVSGIYVAEGYQVLKKSRQEIRMITHNLRKRFNFLEPYLRITKFIEILQDEGFFEIQILSIDEMREEGLAIPAEKLLFLREDVYEKACLGDGRARFTVGHECGHFFLEHDNNRIEGNTNIFSRSCRGDSEWQANTFAGELLVCSQSEVLRFCSSPNDISEEFGVSLPAATVQWEELKKEGLI